MSEAPTSERPEHHVHNGSSLTRNKVFVAVHSGAGSHSCEKENHNKTICKLACHQAMELLSSNRSALDAVTAAMTTLEDDESTNAGYGSNLTVQGSVECDASVMDGATHHFGSVGALSGVKNPVKVASLLVKEQAKGPLPFGRVRPSVLVGKGARTYCAEHGISVNHNMISKSSFKTYSRYKRKCKLTDIDYKDGKKRKLDIGTEECPSPKPAEIPTRRPMPAETCQDTVGAICVDQEGNVAAASSSGGIWLKHPGRLGPVTMFGAGCWAQNRQPTKAGVGVVTSGCGEHLMQTILAKTLADGIRSSDNLSQSLPDVFKADFMESEFIVSSGGKLGGALALKLSDTSDGVIEAELGWIHSTPSFCFAFMGGDLTTPKATMSRLDKEWRAGHSYTMGGHLLCL